MIMRLFILIGRVKIALLWVKMWLMLIMKVLIDLLGPKVLLNLEEV
jgi:hypothetical protein